MNRVPDPAKQAMSRSVTRLLAPMTLVGRTALSVDTTTKRFTPCSTAARITAREPRMLLVTADQGFSSSMGTCL